MQISRSMFNDFKTKWNAGAYSDKRLGQAFYDHFSLEKMSDQTLPNKIYNANSSQALRMIAAIVDWNN